MKKQMTRSEAMHKLGIEKYAEVTRERMEKDYMWTNTWGWVLKRHYNDAQFDFLKKDNGVPAKWIKDDSTGSWRLTVNPKYIKWKKLR